MNAIGNTLIISPFIIGVLNKEFVRGHLAGDKSMPNLQEGTRAAFVDEVVIMFSHQEDWIMGFKQPYGKISILLLDIRL